MKIADMHNDNPEWAKMSYDQRAQHISTVYAGTRATDNPATEWDQQTCLHCGAAMCTGYDGLSDRSLSHLYDHGFEGSRWCLKEYVAAHNASKVGAR
ncbi:hypothetical protein QNA23_11015 [Rhodococcus erythropolis]|uniref:hypothetical protein n=1 Tax=Rhodococcus erythropolis TaxID=1833 RepID=UPI0024B9CFB1|nr:hypothetical protein [Rhodococcus erythropolis]MDJ0404013.1 hypothetical protein [Rhodococcus erythropolis]